MDKLVRIDRNGTEYWESDICPKCHGRGYIDYYHYVEAGRCFMCGGTGRKHREWKIYTPEHAAELERKRIARYKAKAPERNEKKLRSLGFQNGSIFAMLGDTYGIRSELKAAGARFSPIFGWHFPEKPECPAIEVRVDDVFGTNETTGDLELVSDAKDIVEAKKREAEPPSKSEHLYAVGDKIVIQLWLKKRTAYETDYSYYGELQYIYVFEDDAENVYVWKTGKFFEDGELDGAVIKGTVKDNGEYKGVKQTVLTRCKIA